MTNLIKTFINDEPTREKLHKGFLKFGLANLGIAAWNGGLYFFDKRFEEQFDITLLSVIIAVSVLLTIGLSGLLSSLMIKQGYSSSERRS